jgi:hypothetical protein
MLGARNYSAAGELYGPAALDTALPSERSRFDRFMPGEQAMQPVGDILAQ